MKKVKCKRCNGKKTVSVPPYYANPMPKNVEVKCEECNGYGYINVITDPAPITRNY